MPDERLRQLERQWTATGSTAAERELAKARERVRPSIAIVSCVHGNLAALEAVLADVDHLGIRRLICLGDLVGWGPSPLECVDLARARCEVVLRGHHERALFEPAGPYRPYVERSLAWTRRQLQPGRLARGATRERWRFLQTLALNYGEGPDLFTHGSPRDCEELLVQSEVQLGETETLREAFAACERLLFVGHTHQPGLITDGYRAFRPLELDFAWDYTGSGKAIVNVGSVGLPTDGDPRACYVTFDGQRVTWRRVVYDVEATASRVAGIPELSAGEAHPESYLGRLRSGSRLWG